MLKSKSRNHRVRSKTASAYSTYPCPYKGCKRRAKNASGLTQHIKAIHEPFEELAATGCSIDDTTRADFEDALGDYAEDNLEHHEPVDDVDDDSTDYVSGYTDIQHPTINAPSAEKGGLSPRKKSYQ
ncbi:hypothetical protein K474DRAFT_699294 [Panus rudis PR-1116 ss-1]|nr:hypothetical protein K474DRAFT_699294 [Panus rudis PR-1116 ss-1]